MTGLLAVLGYLYFQERQKNEVTSGNLTMTNQQLLRTNTTLDSISTQLDAKIAEIQSLGGNVEELTKVKEQLERDKKSLAGAKASDVRKYEQKIKEYTSILAEKDAELVKLREENQVLTTQNQELATSNEGLKTEITTTRQAYTDTVSQLSTKNRELSDKVSIGAALKVQNVNVYAVNDKGKERERIKANKVEQVRIAFNLPENPITEHNQKEIFVRVLDPSGAIISDMATGSGTFVHQGKEMIYTIKKNVTYQGNNQQVDVLYRNGKPFGKGKHTIELYSEGFKIGQGSFEVKTGLF